MAIIWKEHNYYVYVDCASKIETTKNTYQDRLFITQFFNKEDH